ncbi:hypothetical protein [Schlesneria paludicola]|uniref:hypothetical protein n=1 Tax=Schlesneria paludicola TaxID=360056 RepID=UPI0012F84A5E|nr:hypothetical protein [Schlesneria paludicola]
MTVVCTDKTDVASTNCHFAIRRSSIADRASVKRASLKGGPLHMSIKTVKVLNSRNQMMQT